MSRSPIVAGPRDVPALRLHLLDQWRPGRPFAVGSLLARTALFRPDDKRPEHHWHLRHLEVCDLWWVGEEMLDLVLAVARTIPEDVTPEDIPGLDLARPGLVVFETPIEGTDSDPLRRNKTGSDGPVLVDAICYGPTDLGPDLDLNRPEADRCVSVSSYRRVRFDDGLSSNEMMAALAYGMLDQAHAREAVEENGTLVIDATGEGWYPLGRSDWPVVDTLATPLSPKLAESERVSFEEDRRLLAALLLVASERRMSTIRTERLSHREARPSTRRGLSADVNVVVLREIETPRDEPQGEGRHVGVTYWVDPHSVWQPYGPGQSLRKLIVRRGSLRGQGPFKAPRAKVKALIR